MPIDPYITPLRRLRRKGAGGFSSGAGGIKFGGILLATLLLFTVGCPRRTLAPKPDATTPSAEDTARAVALFESAWQSDDPNLQSGATTDFLDLVAHKSPAVASLEPALFKRLNAASGLSLQTQQAMIDQLAVSPWWRSLAADKKTEALAWALPQRDSKEMERREVAAYALFKLGGAGHLADLTPLITDPERTVRAIVAEAYGSYGGGSEWPTLERFAEDENQYVRLRAAKALAQWIARLGPELDLQHAGTLLEKLKADDDPFVRRMARQASGVGLMKDPAGYRTEIYAPLLRTSLPPRETEEGEYLRDVGLGRFEWSLGYNLPVPSEISRLVFEFLWEEDADLRPSVLDAVMLQPRPEESGFLQSAWSEGDLALQVKVLDLLISLLNTEGAIDESAKELLADIAGRDLTALDDEPRQRVITLLMLLSRSRSAAMFDAETTKKWEEGIVELFYAPRESLRWQVRQLNPQHPWLARAAEYRFKDDERLRKSLPRLDRMVWFGENPELIDPKTGVAVETPVPLSADEWRQCWDWGIVPPLALLRDAIAEGTSRPVGDQLLAAAILLRGAVPLKPLPSAAGVDEEWVTPPESTLPPDSEVGKGA